MSERDFANQRVRVHYIHRLSYSARERLVGLFVLVALAVVFTLIFINGKTAHLFEDRITYHAFLRNAQGITTESVVKVSGIEVGRISSLGISSDNKIRISMYVFERFAELVRADSKAALSKLSIVGNASIEITAGSPDQPLLPDGAILIVEEPLSVDELIAELTPVVEKVKAALENVTAIVAAVPPRAVESTTQDLAVSLANLRDITEQLSAGRGALGQAVYGQELESRVVNSVARLESSLSRADARLAELEPVVANVDAVAARTQKLAGTLDGLVGETRALVGQMNTVMGTVSLELQQFPEIMTRMRLLLESTDRTLEGVQRVWPISSAIKPTTEETLIRVQPMP